MLHPIHIFVTHIFAYQFELNLSIFETPKSWYVARRLGENFYRSPKKRAHEQKEENQQIISEVSRLIYVICLALFSEKRK